MPRTKQQIIEDIRTYIERRGGEPGEWHVGVGTNERARLFKDHRVKERGDWWIVRRAESPQVAREAWNDLAGTLKTATSGTSSGNAADFVYAFRKVDDGAL